MRRPACLLFLCMLPFAAPLPAATVYQCVAGNGQTSYQDTPCAHDRRQRVLDLVVTAPATTPAPASSAVPSAHVAVTPAPAPTAPAAPLAPPPVLYRCTRATDGTTYLSRTGHTRPYLAPSAMLGYAGISPARRRHGRIEPSVSAPELMPGPTSEMIGGRYYLQVRDTCRRLPPAAACAALEQQYETNEEAIRQAFRDERAPLQKRRRQLRARMAGCHG